MTVSAWSATRRLRLKCDVTRAETKLHLSEKRTSPFKSAGASVQSSPGSRGVRNSGSNADYTMFRGSVKSTHSIRQFPLHFPSRASPCAITFQLLPTLRGPAKPLRFQNDDDDDDDDDNNNNNHKEHAC